MAPFTLPASLWAEATGAHVTGASLARLFGMAHEIGTAATEAPIPAVTSEGYAALSPARPASTAPWGRRLGMRARSGTARLAIFALVPITVLALTATAAGAAGANLAKDKVAAHKSATPKPAAPKESLAYYNNHPCSLLTRSEVEQVVHVPMGPGQAQPNAYGGSCNYQTTDDASGINLVYGFNAGSAASTSHISGKTHKEPSVGHGAYCVTTTEGGFPFAELLMNVGNYQGTPYSLDISVDTCAHADALAVIAYSHIS